MMMRGLDLSMAAALAMIVGGCSSEPTPDSAQAVDVAVNIAEAKAKAVKKQAEAAPAPVQPADMAVANAGEAQRFPEAFRGRWGLVAADCDPTRSDAKGLMVVEAATLRFYESRAIIDSITLPSPTEAAAELAYSGEGQTWHRSATLKLEDTGKTLVRVEKDQPGPLRYARCPTV